MANKPIVFLACTGLGRINRGYESFARECYETLKDTNDFSLYLIKGGGDKKQNEIVLPNLPRKNKFTIWLGKLVRKDSYIVEQATFCISLLPIIIKKKPVVIYYSDFILGTYLWHLRRIFKFKYKLLFSNGAPNLPPYKTEDHVQQLLPVYVTKALAYGTAAEKLTLLPYGVNIDLQKSLDRTSESISFKKKFDLPLNKKIIISVGIINTTHKRMDYVVNEFAKLDQNEYFLLLLGQTDEESDAIKKLAAEKLQKESYSIKQVTSEEVIDYMAASEYFILASLNEGLPRVLPEALSNGLLPIVHDYPVTRQTLGEFGVFKNLTVAGALSEAIKEVDAKGFVKKDIITYSWKNYSWENLKPGYRKMICEMV